ncbi:MAG: TonB-dependent receptor [Saprospiraceae bacterium]|nr:TonB-dependent receptor [Saprospiraceae bacterium]
MIQRFLSWCVSLLLVIGLPAQSDSLIKEIDRLGYQDLIFKDSLAISTQVSAASRSLQNISELPFSIHVIQREEIINNGYLTLVDALKSMPGIRVSQPGSALEGETFTMRGLLGNTYAKILVNGNPIKPYVVSGMPIGAQLPIQQAERIEVIYGPAAALYGADASSGIINIVLADSEYPVFTKASLHVGSDNYKSLNLLFGGKIGRGKDIVRFKLYGTDTRFDNRRIFYNEALLYNPLNYIGPNSDTTDIVNDPNFRGRPNTSNIQNTPHESRSLGGEVNYRFLSLSLLNMNRRDHSSIGYNPAAVSYSNPLISTGENITSALVKAQFKINNLSSESKFQFLGYNMDNRSSNQFVHPILNSLLYNTIADSTNTEALQGQVENTFFSGLRFMGANSNEYSIEQTFNLPVFSGGDFMAGLKYLVGSGDAIREFQARVVNFEQDDAANLAPVFTDQGIEEYSLFLQLFQPLGKRINLLVSGQFLNRTNGDFAARIRTFNPRLAILYKLSDEVQLRGSYSTAIRAPSPYFSASSYTFQADTEYLQVGVEQLEAEKTGSYEVGMRWDNEKKLNLDVNVSYTRTDQFINYNIAFERMRPLVRLTNFTLGYFNDENSAAELFDMQAYLQLRDLIPAIQLGATLSLNYATGTESLTTTNLGDFNNEVRVLDDVRAHPNFISRLSLFATPLPHLTVGIDQYFASRSLTRNSFRLNAPNMQNREPTLYNDGYHTIDLKLSYELNKNFLLYAKGFNILNTQYAGIDASSSNDILFYNPQALFTFHLGLNYELN